ncbi:hypothetical protein [Devosia submarina]|uniref:hypothetical protein n=1 Tax=Devosia submarina TaxID=1173082 RepID=UPI0013003E3C|nr:hypothetical protein [Devosia submarina]
MVPIKIPACRNDQPQTASGVIRLELPSVEDADLTWQAPNPSKDVKDDDLDDDDVEPIGGPVDGLFIVEASYWQEHRDTQPLKTGLADVPASYLTALLKSLGSRSNVRTLNQLRPDLSDLQGLPLRVLDANASLDAIFPLVELTEPKRRFPAIIYRRRLLYELQAAAWRYLAIAQPKDQHGVVTDVFNALVAYIDAMGIDEEEASTPKEHSLRNLAGAVVRQWRAKNLTSPVLLRER